MVLTLEADARVDFEQKTTCSRAARLSRLARFALDNSPYRQVAQLDCQVAGCALVVSGVVPTYFLKQLAQETLLRLDSDYPIENRVEVFSRAESGENGRYAAS